MGDEMSSPMFLKSIFRQGKSMADTIVKAPKAVHPFRTAKNVERFIFCILLTPALLLVTVFILLPVFTSIFYSLYNWNGMGPLTPEKFVKLDNFSKALNNEWFWNALKNNGIVIAFSIIVQLPAAFMLAIFISRKNTKPMVFFRAVCFLPYILSEVITGTIWTFIYHPRNGLVKAIVGAVAPGTDYGGLLAAGETLLPALLVVIFWKYFGLHMIIYIAGFQVIPTEYYEAAKIDGAHAGQILRHITIPQMRPAIQMSLFFCIIGSIQLFDVIWAMGQGDPYHAGETAVVFLFKYAVRIQQMGYGSAIAILIFLLCLVFNLFYQRIVRDK
jgi:raffinose/stachyose/melibiose transport system permease protein